MMFCITEDIKIFLELFNIVTTNKVVI